MSCEICGGESRLNAHEEIWCRGCAMLTRACKCLVLKNQIT